MNAEFGFLAKWGGSCVVDYSGPDSCDGQFRSPRGIAVDLSGNVYVADAGNNRIQKFDPNGNFITKSAVTAQMMSKFTSPGGVAADPSGNVYVADLINSRIQKFSSNGTFLAKWGSEGSGDGQFGYTDPGDLSTDQSGNIFDPSSGNVYAADSIDMQADREPRAKAAKKEPKYPSKTSTGNQGSADPPSET